VSESKENAERKKDKQSLSDMDMLKIHRNQLKDLSMAKVGTILQTK
jgi:hypothetical protein